MIMTDETRIDTAFFARAIRDDVLSRLRAGAFSGSDVAALRRMLNLSQAALATQLDLSVDTIQNWEQGRCQPDGPARTLIRLLATRPGLILRLLQPAA
jgi:putative transcriptional regulator